MNEIGPAPGIEIRGAREHNLRGVDVSTRDGAHSGWVSPYDYHRGHFSIGDYTHQHDVRWAADKSELLCRPAGLDNHTHTIDAPVVPDNRIVVPVQEAMPSEMHPFMVNVREDRGWTVLESPHGLGPVLTLAFDVGDVREIPYQQPRPDYVVGLGYRKPATSVHVLTSRPDVARRGQLLELVVRTEDEDTGGVPHQSLWADVAYLSADGTEQADTAHAVAVESSDYRAEALLRVQVEDRPDAEALRLDFYLGSPEDPGDATRANRHTIALQN